MCRYNSIITTLNLNNTRVVSFDIGLDIQRAHVETLVMVILPLISGVLMTLSQSLKAREKWAFLEEAKLSTKSEIYRYRSRTGNYSNEEDLANEWNTVLEKYKKWTRNKESNEQNGLDIQIQMVESSSKRHGRKRLTGSKYCCLPAFLLHVERLLIHCIRADLIEIGDEVLNNSIVMSKHKDQAAALQEVLSRLWGGGNQKHFSTSLKPQDQKIANAVDDGFSPLNAEQYIMFRVQPALLDLDVKLPRIQLELRFWQILAYFATGAATVLAVQDLKVWIAFTVTLVATMSAIISFKFLEVRLASLNKSQTELQNLLLWWTALEPEERVMMRYKTQLVDKAESALLVEVKGLRQALDTMDNDKDPADGPLGSQTKALTGMAENGLAGGLMPLIQPQLEPLLKQYQLEWSDVEDKIIERLDTREELELAAKDPVKFFEGLLQTCLPLVVQRLVQPKVEPMLKGIFKGFVEWSDVAELVANIETSGDLLLAANDPTGFMTANIKPIATAVLGRELKETFEPKMQEFGLEWVDFEASLVDTVSSIDGLTGLVSTKATTSIDQLLEVQMEKMKPILKSKVGALAVNVTPELNRLNDARGTAKVDASEVAAHEGRTAFTSTLSLSLFCH
jgi:hypothetical protein